MYTAETGTSKVENSALVAAACAGDESAFAQLVQRYERELQVHCYRMLASFEDAEDLTQETFLRAWRKRESFQGRSTFRAWLYRIATNGCLDFLDRRPERRLAEPTAGKPVPAVAIPWLQPYPDQLLEEVAPADSGPDAVLVAKETIELAFLVAIQHLPPKQRAVLILRDVLGWPASDTSDLLEGSVASVNSALQRARATLKRQLPEHRLAWAPAGQPSQEERAVLQRYMEASEKSDMAALAALLRNDARCGQQAGASGHHGTDPVWYEGRDTIITAWSPALDGPHAVEFRLVETSANRQPACAAYIKAPGDTHFRAFGLDVLRIEGEEVAEVNAFVADVFPKFGLPAVL